MDEYRHYKVAPEPLTAAARVGIAGSVISPPDREVSLKEQAEEVARSAAALYNDLDLLVNGPRPTAPIDTGGDKPYTVIQQVRVSLGEAIGTLFKTRDLVAKLAGEIGG